MKKLTDKVHGCEWDTLVILDSFRYDYFIDEYQHFPYIKNSDVEKVMSPGSATPEVAPKLFPDAYDYNLYSANKVVHEKAPIEDRPASQGFITGWNAESTFNNVVEIESSTHNETRFTPSPEDEIHFINENKDIINKEKSVLWLMQPHTPYFGDVQLNIRDDGLDISKLRDDNHDISESVKYLFRRSYRGNVREALWIVTSLLGELEGDIAITSDHGELLFDQAIQDRPGFQRSGPERLRSKRSGLGHHVGSSHSKLRNVPWVEIDATNCDSIYEMGAEKFVELSFNCVLNRELDEDARKNFPQRIESYERGEGTVLQSPYSRKDLIMLLIRAKENNKTISASDNSNSNIPEKQLKELGYL